LTLHLGQGLRNKTPGKAWPRPERKARLKGKQPKLPLSARKTIHRRYHDPDDDASLADLAEEYSVGRSTIHRIISDPRPRA
jgi:hypothetical protein